MTPPGAAPQSPPRDPPQIPTVTEVVYTTRVVYLPVLINLGSRFDFLRTRLPVNHQPCYQELQADGDAAAATQEAADAASEQRCCSKRGLGMHHQTTKNNRPQVEKGPKPLYCTSGCDKTVKRFHVLRTKGN